MWPAAHTGGHEHHLGGDHGSLPRLLHLLGGGAGGGKVGLRSSIRPPRLSRVIGPRRLGEAPVEVFPVADSQRLSVAVHCHCEAVEEADLSKYDAPGRGDPFDEESHLGLPGMGSLHAKASRVDLRLGWGKENLDIGEADRSHATPDASPDGAVGVGIGTDVLRHPGCHEDVVGPGVDECNQVVASQTDRLESDHHQRPEQRLSEELGPLGSPLLGVGVDPREARRVGHALWSAEAD